MVFVETWLGGFVRLLYMSKIVKTVSVEWGMIVRTVVWRLYTDVSISYDDNDAFNVDAIDDFEDF